MSQRDLRPGQPAILGVLQRPVLGSADLVYGVMDVLGDVELVEDDLGVGGVEVRPGGGDVGLPHVHGEGLDALPLGRSQGRPEAVQALLLAVIGEVQDPAPGQIRDHREVAMPLRDGLLVHAEVGDHLPAPPGQTPDHGPLLDPPGLVPADPEEVGCPLDGALAEQVLRLLERSEFRPTDASRRTLADLHLAARVRAVLKAQPETTRLDVDVRAEAGRVMLAGTVPSAGEREAAERVARGLPGVLDVTNRLVATVAPIR